MSSLLPGLVIFTLVSAPVTSLRHGQDRSIGDNATVGLKLMRVNDNEFTLRIDEYTFNFKRRKEVSSVWTAADHEWRKREASITVDLYEDSVSGASVIIDKEDASGRYQVSGVLDDNRIITPLEGGGPEPDVSACDEDGCLATVPHHVRNTNEANDGPDTESDYEQVEAQYPRARRGKALMPGKIHPEILIFVDYFLYEKLGFDKEKTKKYVVSFFNAVNMRFKSLASPRIELFIAGVVIAETKSAFPFISENIRKKDMIDAASTLHDMGRYFYKERADLPIYDIVVTMTGLDMSRMKGGRRTRATSGYAYVGGACVRNVRLEKISSVALVEDSGGYSGVVVTAHELGHLLGAVHDGDAAPSYLRGPGAKACPWSAGYIMSDLRHTARGQAWSQCSAKQIRHFLATLTASCLYNAPASNSPGYSLPGPATLPGASISLDDQCGRDKGTRACYHDHRVCAQLFCYTPNYRSCYAYRPAVEGSKCGHGKMCINGKCIVNSSSQGQDKPPVKRSSKKSTKNVGGKTRKSRQKSSKNQQRSKHTTSNVSKSSRHMLPRKSKSTQDSDCSDSFALIGSLNCDRLLKRYSHLYCGKSKVVREKCCKSYNKYCGNV